MFPLVSTCGWTFYLLVKYLNIYLDELAWCSKALQNLTFGVLNPADTLQMFVWFHNPTQVIVCF